MPSTLIRNRPAARWPHRRTTHTLAEGGVDLADKHKPDAIGMVRIVTAGIGAVEIIGYLMRNDEDLQVRVLHCLGYVRRHYNARPRLVWQISAVRRSSIIQMRRLD